MVHLFKNDPSIGIVGNLHIKKDGIHVDSCGSEWGGNFFDHIGKDIYKGKRLGSSLRVDSLPPDLRIPAERQMVTGACFMVSRKVFDRVGGFDTNYRIGYWEDADFCLKTRLAGYKVFFQPKSKITHFGHHSQLGNNPFIEQNKRKFYKDWVDNGVLDLLNKDFGKPRENVKQGKSVIYTAITKGYDRLLEKQNVSSGEFVSFVEDPVKSKTWTVRPLQKNYEDANRNAKIYKVSGI
jgi:GT2 family glycosyltransferase